MHKVECGGTLSPSPLPFFSFSLIEAGIALGIEAQQDCKQDGEAPQRRTAIAEEGQGDANHGGQADDHAHVDKKVEGEDGEMIEVTQDCYYDATMGENAYIGGIYALNASASANWKLVPEPTTATLSLLALAGMAMRRRRK